MMPATVVAMAVLLLVALLLTLPAETALAAAVAAGEQRRLAPAPAPALAFVKFRARLHLHRRQPFFRGRAGNGCMPRAFRVPPSAPSRYVNYDTLDAGLCGHGERRKP